MTLQTGFITASENLKLCSKSAIGKGEINMPLKVVYDDIVKMKVDAIVNAANEDLLMGGGVCGAIFNAAGARKLQKACNEMAPIATGEAVITSGYNLPAEYIIHAVGPIYDPRNPKKSKEELWSAYMSSLKLAKLMGLNSIAFPLISSGIYGYPPKEALKVAKDTINEFLKVHDMDVYLVLYKGAKK